MPLHKVGYRPWNGKKTPHWNRWWIISETGIRLAFKSTWVRRLLLLCWLPVLYWGVAIFVVEQTFIRTNFDDQQTVSQQSDPGELINRQINRQVMLKAIDRIEDDMKALPEIDSLREAVETGEVQDIRHTVWNWLLMMFFRYPQGTAILFLLGFITPGLISQDVRSRAFLLYFSRPIGRLEYILGKFFVPAVFVALVTTIPALCLYFFGISLSPDISVLRVTWDIPLRVAAASVCLVVPTCSIALMLSSVTQESRFATFAWFALWALGLAAWLAIGITRAVYLKGDFWDVLMNDEVVNKWSVVSLYNNLAAVQSWIFDFEPLSEIWPSLAILIAISVFSFVILYRGVSAPMNV